MCHNEAVTQKNQPAQEVFQDTFVSPTKPRLKKARLGRYEAVKKSLNAESDRYKQFVEVQNFAPPYAPFHFVDLFSGAGGITQGMQAAGFNPVASVESVPVASATHQRNFPTCRHFCGDIADFDPVSWLAPLRLPRIHLVTGGPPCQGFSVAGKRDPNDPRNKLFQQFVRVVSQIKPWYIVMENVPGILTMQKGRVREAIGEAFAEIGYPDMSVSVLEAAEYGVPQIRARAIFVANRLGLPNPFPKAQRSPDKYQSIESAIGDLPTYTPLPQINHEWTKHSAEFMERIASVPPGGSLYPSFLDAFKRQYPGLPAMTVKENHGGTHIHPHLNRVISAREMARLQTFPDDFIFEGTMKKAMWQIGNAVPPRLAECIGLALRPYLEHAANGNEAVTPLPLKPEATVLVFD